MNLNKGISTPIAILLIVVVVAAVGILVWQFTKPAERPTKQAGDYTTQAACQNAGFHWYDNSCHEEGTTTTAASPPPEESWVQIISPQPGETLTQSESYTVNWKYTDKGEEIISQFDKKDLGEVKVKGQFVLLKGPVLITLRRGRGTQEKSIEKAFQEDESEYEGVKERILATSYDEKLVKEVTPRGISFKPAELEWTVPSNIPSAEDYFLEIVPVGRRDLATASRGKNFSIRPAEKKVKIQNLEPYQAIQKGKLTVEGKSRKVCFEKQISIKVTGAYDLKKTFQGWCEGQMSSDWRDFEAEIDLSEVPNCYINLEVWSLGGPETETPLYVLPLKVEENCK